MANQAHLDVLSGGVRAWNNWRKAHSEKLPDLRNADLKGKNLCGANFRRANLERANLEGAVLSTADLSFANLSWANLSGVSLRKANLGGATFNETILDGTKFHDTIIRATTFINVNLSVAKGLDKADHLGPSSLDFGTIYHSKGDIAEDFLYGAGIPDIFIDYIRSQGKAPFDYYSCFLSYASEDQSFVERLHGDLEAEGVRCWLAPVDLKPGDRFPQQIEDAIRHHDKLILVLSKNSLQSGWVEHEVNLAREREHKGKDILCPICLDNVYLSSRSDWVTYLQHTRDIGDFKYWEYSNHYNTAFKLLLEGLEKDDL